MTDIYVHILGFISLALFVSRHPSPPLEVREGQRGALWLRRLASGWALVVVRTPRVPRARVLRFLHLHLPRRRRRARLVPLNHIRVEIVVPQAPHRNAFDWNFNACLIDAKVM